MREEKESQLILKNNYVLKKHLVSFVSSKCPKEKIFIKYYFCCQIDYIKN